MGDMLNKAKYLISVVDKTKLLTDGIPEVAFVGRSNVGKSSIINALVRQKKLARTSSTPGLTKMVNYFDVDGKLRLVDLPGYGYAKAGKQSAEKWDDLIGAYLTTSKDLKVVFVLVDIRLPATELDKHMIEYLNYYEVPFLIVATKADKLAKSKVYNEVVRLKKEFGAEVIAVSAENGIGCEELRQRIMSY